MYCPFFIACLVTDICYTRGMSKIITCPICGKKEIVRNDANVCGSNCRVKRWRKMKDEKVVLELERKGVDSVGANKRKNNIANLGLCKQQGVIKNKIKEGLE